MATIYELREGDSEIRKVAEYSLPPKKALICYISQYVNGNFATWGYPEDMDGIRESTKAPNHFYYDRVPMTSFDKPSVLAAYPA